MIKFAIKDKIEGNELDLSLNELTEVPVKELAAAPKATHLDLSCNRIECLPANFATLTHLVKIDLSKNSVKELPYNFGNLINLQFLDLYANEIEILPVSFCRLKSLRWLDLKNNPLDSKLKAIAGDCLDEKQCQSCAKKVVSFMQVIESELEREKQKRLKVEREKEAKKKAKEEHELEVQRRLKKAERERKKAESKARKEEAQQQQSQNSSGGDVPVNNDANSNMKIKQTPKSGMSWTTVFALLLAIPLLCAVAMVAFRVINGHQVQSVTDLSNVFEEACLELHELLSVWWQAFLIPYFHCTKASVLQLVHSISLFNASSVF